MANVALPVYLVVYQSGFSSIKISDKSIFNKKDTYYVVFSLGQEKLQEAFEKEFAKEIIFKSEQAHNINYSSLGNRNTLFIFEMQEFDDE